ncbi:MAG TPA: NDP-sugar synthase [Acidimicrobiales bacterium]|nr:NDP-sugar synthase [Acidimicrobiales bacterium]
MRAVVLVGGEGTRLRPLTFTTPKQMLPIVEVTMIERVLAHLASFGVDDVVLSMGYRPDAFLAAFPDDACAGVALAYAVEPEPLDTAGAVRFAATHAGIDETFLVVNGDVLTDLDIGALVGFHRARGAEATIALTPVEDPSAFGVVPTDEAGRVTAFIEKPPPGEAPTNLINAGTYVLEPSVLERIAGDRRVSIERETFPALVADGSCYALASDTYWIDTGTPAKFLQANLDLLSGRRGDPASHAHEVDPGVWYGNAGPVVDGEVVAPSFIGDAAFVARGARVEGSVLGAGARVADGAVVRGSVILPGAVVAGGAVVEGSIVGENAVVGENARVGGLTVVGGSAEVEPGTTLDGARLPVSVPAG